MKKSVLVLLAAVGAAVLMTGCGKEKTEPSDAQSVGRVIDKKTDEAGKDLKKAADDAGKEIKKGAEQGEKDLKNLGDKLKK